MYTMQKNTFYVCSMRTWYLLLFFWTRLKQHKTSFRHQLEIKRNLYDTYINQFKLKEDQNSKHDITIVMDNNPTSEKEINPSLDTLNQNIYNTDESFEYFCRNSDHLNSSIVPSYLVGRAFCKTNNAHLHIHEDGVLLHLVMAKFVASLTRY